MPRLGVYASMLCAHPLRLEEEIRRAGQYCDGLHWDVMDGHYVPNLTFGPHIVRAAREVTPNVWFDVHIMACPGDAIIPLFWDLPIQSLAFHPNTVEDPLGVLEGLKMRGIQGGLAVNLEDQLETWPKAWWAHMDYGLVMAVKPGFGGQAFGEAALKNIQKMVQLLPDKPIWVDGGVNAQTASMAVAAGASGLISGNFLFGQENFEEGVGQLKVLSKR